jgi:hypothetical protein
MATQSNDWIVLDYTPRAMDQFDRRANQRYPITLEVEYKVPDGNGGQRKGLGRTIDIASRGLLLDVSDPLPNRCPIQLSINWPFLLDGSIPLKLLMYGNIVQVAGNRIAVEVTRHVFHLAGHATQQA